MPQALRDSLIQLVFIILLIVPAMAGAETIHLTDGRVVEGKIIAKGTKCIKVDLVDSEGIMTYCIDEITDIDGQPFTPQETAGKALPQSVAKEQPATETITDQIQHILKHLGYPESTWGPIERQVVDLLAQINFPLLKQEALQAKSDPQKLKAFITKLGELLQGDGYINQMDPHPLVRSLTLSFANDDISQVIFTSPISFFQKVDSKKALVACTAISQLGSILLKLLDINVKAAVSPAHIFNAVLLDDRHVLIVDFSNQIFEVLDTGKYYLSLGSKTMMLKDQYRISPDRLREINAQIPSEYHSDSLQELLNFLYLYIYITDDYAATPAIFVNFGNIYSCKGNYDQAFNYFNKAIALDPDFAEAYRERGITYGNRGDLDQAISDYSKAIELYPDFAEAYDYRASVYSARSDYDSAINDLNQAVIIDPNYAEAFHDRGKAYSNKGDMDSAISDYNKAIEIDPYYSEAYSSRAQAYFTKGEYDKSWADIRKVEDFGDEVDPGLLDKIKKASEFKTFFLPGLIILLILMVLLFRLF